MTARRKTKLVDCNPKWRRYDGKDGTPDAITFDCPEGHEGCTHTIPFTPAMDGSKRPVLQRNGAQWERVGDTFETLRLQPSIRVNPPHKDRDAALAAGCRPDLITERLLCAFHGYVGGSQRNRPGEIEFCADSR